MAFVKITHPSVSGSAEVTEESFPVVWQPLGWVLQGASPTPHLPATMVWLGPWLSTVTYRAGQVVSRNGSSYVAKVPSLNHDPNTSPEHWDPAAVAGGVASVNGLIGEVDLSGILVETASVGVAGGVAALDASAKVPYRQLDTLVVQPGEAYNDVVTVEGSNPRPLEYFGGYLWGVVGADIKRSADSGATWTQVANFTPGVGGGIFRILPCADGEVLVVRPTSIHRSVGWAANPATATWSQRHTPNLAAYFLHGHVDGNGTKFIASQYADSANWADSRYVHISLDGGVTWVQKFDSDANAPGDAANSHLHGVCYDPWEDRFYFSEGHGVGVGVYYSDNDGTSWTKVGGTFQPNPAPFAMCATDHGIVCGSDAVQNGIYRIPRVSAAQLRMDWIWKWRTPHTGLVGFARRCWRDPETGIVYVAFRSEYTNTKPVIAASDGRTGIKVWEAPLAPTVGSANIYGAFVTDDRRLAAHWRNDSTENHLYADVRNPGVQSTNQLDQGNIFGGVSSDATSVAIGPGAVASAARSTAVGVDSLASALPATALGDNAKATAAEAVAIGAATAAGSSSVVIGDLASAVLAATLSVVIGKSASAAGTRGVAVGNSAAAGADAVALGALSVASVAKAVAVGQLASATGADSTVVGYNARTSAGLALCVAIGSQANVTAAAGVAVGQSTAASNRSVAVGYLATATLTDAVAIGSQASGGHLRSVALGQLSATTRQDQVAFGLRHLEMLEVTDPTAGAANSVRLYAEDNGSGKTRLMMRFATGAAQQIGIEA